MTPTKAFWRGYLDCAPFILIVVPYSMLFGVVARDAGLDVLQTMSMSVLVIAGASQFTALALLQDQAPVFIALLTALAVNLRMAMYSAALVPHVGHARFGTRALMAYLMVDQAFAVAVKTYEDRPEMTPDAKVAYYFGAMMLICPIWYGCTFLGAVMGQAIPDSWSLDFAVPVCFIALTAPLLRSLPHVVAALTSCAMAIAFGWVPWSLGIIFAALIAMAVGAQTELYLKRREARAA
ncbi:AzlC family ABC transporter permease [Marivita hallyeonensis]|uniref:Predicted branched-chain amino acid permease (Azaleucine resistance) n=1 Tax=Marivita hallyeonensis TaxID=996342 RepID=A0A1M5Y1J2_9RHOB|nr:AzlC family ABC transporter permease [Marivita hallyeonensis]SHI05917.1 Predicted branched-chain amino acid permease (azaleucine resistance) [Marivita hallyeonensis]